MEADPNVTDDEIRAFGTGSLKKAVFDGDLSGGSFLAGEVSGMITRIEPAAAIVDDIIGGAQKLLAKANQLI
jgi:enoyl-[acyl-carrier protein] reductase II